MEDGWGDGGGQEVVHHHPELVGQGEVVVEAGHWSGGAVLGLGEEVGQGLDEGEDGAGPVGGGPAGGSPGADPVQEATSGRAELRGRRSVRVCGQSRPRR